jgi:hypothetical protein
MVTVSSAIEQRNLGTAHTAINISGEISEENNIEMEKRKNEILLGINWL